MREMIIINNDERERERESEGSVVCEGFYFLYRMNIKTPPLIILLKPSKVRMIMMDEASKRMMNEWMLFLPQGGVRRRPERCTYLLPRLREARRRRRGLPRIGSSRRQAPRRAAGGNGELGAKASISCTYSSL